MWACSYGSVHGSTILRYSIMTAPVSLKVRMLKVEVTESLQHGCVTWILSAKHFAKLRTAHHQALLRVIHWLPAPTNLPTTPSARTPRPSRRHNERASKRPSVNNGSSLRGAWRGRLQLHSGESPNYVLVRISWGLIRTHTPRSTRGRTTVIHAARKYGFRRNPRSHSS